MWVGIHRVHTIVGGWRLRISRIYGSVVKMAITRDGKGTTHYLVFKDYHPARDLGVRVSNKQYDKCELNDKYYIICVKTAAKPYLLVYPTKSYILHEDMAERMRK